MTPLLELIVAATAFVGTHVLLSHPLRAPLVARLGEKGFSAVYAVIALATMAWMTEAFRAVPAGAVPLWDGSGAAVWTVASLLTLLAAVLLIGSLRGNPALPDPRAAQHAAAPVQGVFHVTRHPMMWGFGLWALAHALVAGTPRVLVLTAAIALLALGGAALQDGKKAAQLGADWQAWAGRTSYWPRPAGLARAGLGTWLGGTVLWLVATWGHIPLAYVPAGPWRWIAG
ncbi:NnrU family protein [Novosphingobium piscinae]|uniref:MFS transporter n=1 Tax=Novosphingobium piscinae TaxID=1507448 RepID=A0A7X1FZS8_9SPHN|nr:NnrU family protein [Novosphingobium piscinae]MBC2670015.1 MFS transporter [Novosphingobium piscinae]